MNHNYIEKTNYKLDCPIHYWISDNKSNSWIVFLHGAGLDHNMFNEQLRALDNTYKILLIDIRGHGKSRPIGVNFTFDIIISDIIEILDKEYCERAIFIGHSMGGNIAEEINFRYPKRVEKLVLIGSVKSTKKRKLNEKLKVATTSTLDRLYSFDMLIKQNNNISSNKEDVRKYVEKCYRNIGREDFLKIFNETLKFHHYEKKYNINKPILFLCGEHDTTLKIKKEAYNWINKEEDCNFHIIKNAKHNCNQDNPKKVNELMMNFIKN